MLTPYQYKHIIWDWNGTLLDDAWLFVDIMNGVLENRNMNTITVEKYRKIFGFPVKEYYKKLGFDLKKESFYESGLEFIRAYEKRRYEADLYPMVNSILSKLVSMNIHHSILSAQHQVLLDDLTKYYNIRKYFTEINGLSDYYARSKIDKGIEWMKKTGHNPLEVLFIGDTDHDFEVAQSLGTDCLLISHGHHCHSRLVQTGAPVIRELKNILHIFGIDLNSAEKCRN
mgnify:FL=1